MVQTVTGPIDAAELGRTLCHEHLAINLSSVREDDDSAFTDSDLVRMEVARAKTSGIASFIETTCAGMGRDPRALRAISRSCGVHVVCSTGFYLESYHPLWVRHASIEKIEDFLLFEFSHGIGGTGIKPGVIGEIAGEEDGMSDSERRVMRASARAAANIGCAVTTHCQLGRLALEQADLLLSEGIRPEKVVLGHLDLADDIPYCEKVLALGVTIGFDTCGKESYLADERRIRTLFELVEHGFAGQIILSNDVSRTRYMTANGGYGYAGVMERIVPALLKRGVGRVSIDMMLQANPASVFDIDKDLA